MAKKMWNHKKACLLGVRKLKLTLQVLPVIAKREPLGITGACFTGLMPQLSLNQQRQSTE